LPDEPKNLPCCLLLPVAWLKAFTTETFDNSKNPVACFEGLGSIFRKRGERHLNESTKLKARSLFAPGYSCMPLFLFSVLSVSRWWNSF
jgi:hypothetical protein